jgi:hypothetical protein
MIGLIMGVNFFQLIPLANKQILIEMKKIGIIL